MAINDFTSGRRELSELSGLVKVTVSVVSTVDGWCHGQLKTYRTTCARELALLPRLQLSIHPRRQRRTYFNHHL